MEIKIHPIRLGLTCGQHIESLGAFHIYKPGEQQISKFFTTLGLALIPGTGAGSISGGERVFDQLMGSVPTKHLAGWVTVHLYLWKSRRKTSSPLVLLGP